MPTCRCLVAHLVGDRTVVDTAAISALERVARLCPGHARLVAGEVRPELPEAR